MSMTAVVAELLIVGLGTLTWVGLLVVTLFGFDWVGSLVVVFEKAGPLLTMVAASLAYILGTVVEQLADALVQPWEKCIKDAARKKYRSDVKNGKLDIYYRFEQATPQLDYMRSRRRLLRSSLLNVLLITTFALTFVWTQLQVATTLQVSLAWTIGIVGATMVILTAFAYHRITKGYFLDLQYFDEKGSETEKSDPPDKPQEDSTEASD